MLQNPDIKIQLKAIIPTKSFFESGSKAVVISAPILASLWNHLYPEQTIQAPASIAQIKAPSFSGVRDTVVSSFLRKYISRCKKENEVLLQIAQRCCSGVFKHVNDNARWKTKLVGTFTDSRIHFSFFSFQSKRYYQPQLSAKDKKIVGNDLGRRNLFSGTDLEGHQLQITSRSKRQSVSPIVTAKSILSKVIENENSIFYFIQ
jgi:hypothetical protein